MANFPIDACIDGFSHLLGVHRLFNRPALDHVPSESPFVAYSEPRNLALPYQLVNCGRVEPQQVANFLYRQDIRVVRHDPPSFLFEIMEKEISTYDS
jgi:hypothetical protein